MSAAKQKISEDPRPVVVRPEPERVLISWTAKARPFKKRNREFYVTIIGIAAIVGLILFFIEGFMPVLLIISLVFLYYVMNTIEPEDVGYKITSRGIKIENSLTGWEWTSRFWFSRRLDVQILNIEIAKVPGRLELVIDSSKRGEIREALLTYITEEKLPPSMLDKAALWFSKKLPQG